MKDKDFLKAINLCYSDSDTKCAKCPFQDIPYCKDFLKSNIANFVNVQEAKIKRLKQDVQTVKNKAYKELTDLIQAEITKRKDINYQLSKDVIGTSKNDVMSALYFGVSTELHSLSKFIEELIENEFNYGK